MGGVGGVVPTNPDAVSPATLPARVSTGAGSMAKGASPSQVRAVVRRLTALKYLDDVSFAARWADRRLERMPMGRARMQEELLATGCPEPIVHATLRAAYRKVSERDLAMQVVTMAGRISSAQARGRVARLLSQRGFDEDTIETVMGPLMREGS